jgi:hypothetical protein
VSAETFGVGLDSKLESKIVEAINKAGSDPKKICDVFNKYKGELEMVDLTLDMANITPQQVDKDLSRDKITLNEIPFHDLVGPEVLEAFKVSLQQTVESKLQQERQQQQDGEGFGFGLPSEGPLSTHRETSTEGDTGSHNHCCHHLPALVDLILKSLSRTGSAGDSYIFANTMFVSEQNIMTAVDEREMPSVPIKVTVGGLPLYHTEKNPKGLTVTIETDSYFELRDENLKSLGKISVLHVQVLDLGDCSTMQRFLQVRTKNS